MKSHRLANIPGSTRIGYWAVLGLATLVLIARLVQLQVMHRTDYRLQSDQNRIREVTLKPLRGLIYDRNGNLLVNNHPAFSLYAVPYELRRNPDLYQRIAENVDRTPTVLKTIVQQNMRGYFQPIRLMRQVDMAVVTDIEEKRTDFPGVGFWIEPIRSFPSSARASHVLGYLGEVTTEELEENTDVDYEPGDVIGKKGIEKIYERLLRGESGLEYVEVDAFGREVRTLKSPPKKEIKPGLNLHLTLDSELQHVSEELMKDLRGSIVMMDLQDGGLLSIVSKPDFDPAELSGVISTEVWDRMQYDPDHPLYDRSLQSVYPPGSTFKLVLAMAAIANDVVKPSWSINCFGSYRLGRRAFKCWKPKGHGRVDLYQAIEQSCNVYFYQLGLKVGLEEWAKFSRYFLLGRKTGIDIPLESAGIVPDKKFMDERYGEGEWTRGMMLNLSVGQGDLLVTTLQMVQFAGLLAKKGVYYTPHLLQSIYDPISDRTESHEADSLRIESISERAYDIVREGMRLVVNGENGTAKLARVTGVEVAGKTGTAQNPHGEDHAWFIGFGPFENPKVAIVVLVENGGGGGAKAAPKAGELLKFYFDKNPDQSADTLAEK